MLCFLIATLVTVITLLQSKVLHCFVEVVKAVIHKDDREGFTHIAGDCGSGDICFSNSDCTGAQISAGSARDCCVGTDDGLSYGSPGDCRECIGEYNYACLR